MADPLVSVLIANYNNERFISDAINSVFAQNYSNWEIIIFDDGSKSNKWFDQFNLSSLTNKIYFYSENVNHGCGYAKKKLIDYCNGDFFIFLDPDDSLHERCISELLRNILLDNSNCISYGTHFICNDILEVKYVSDYPSKVERGRSMFNLDSGNISAPALISKSHYKLTRGINQDLQKAVDNDLYAIMEEVGFVSFVNIPLYYYRQHDTNISLGKHELEALRYRLIVIEDLFNRRNINRSEYTSNISLYEKYEIEFLYFKNCFHKSSVTSSLFWYSVFKMCYLTLMQGGSPIRVLKLLRMKIISQA